MTIKKLSSSLKSTNGKRSASTTPKTGSSDAAIDQMLTQLEKLWKNHRTQELAARWKTGKLLNERLGSPTKRQTYGEGVLKKAAKRTGRSRSELSRMRSFAHLASDMDRWLKKHNVRTWTQVKMRLPKAKSKSKASQQASKKLASQPVDQALESLKAALNLLKEVKSPLGAQARKQLQDIIKTFSPELPRVSKRSA